MTYSEPTVCDDDPSSLPAVAARSRSPSTAPHQDASAAAGYPECPRQWGDPKIVAVFPMANQRADKALAFCENHILYLTRHRNRPIGMKVGMTSLSNILGRWLCYAGRHTQMDIVYASPAEEAALLMEAHLIAWCRTEGFTLPFGSALTNADNDWGGTGRPMPSKWYYTYVVWFDPVTDPPPRWGSRRLPRDY